MARLLTAALILYARAARSIERRPGVLLLGDSRDRDTFAVIAGVVCSREAWNWTQATPDATVAGGATCRPSAEIAALGYFLHYGVSSDGIYHSAGFGWRHHMH
eukprot:2324100-Prymnesium_polylepis.1